MFSETLFNFMFTETRFEFMFTETRFEFMFSETLFNFMFTGLMSFGNPPFYSLDVSTCERECVFCARETFAV